MNAVIAMAATPQEQTPLMLIVTDDPPIFAESLPSTVSDRRVANPTVGRIHLIEARTVTINGRKASDVSFAPVTSSLCQLNFRVEIFKR